jgi:hypothetical protein
MSYFLDRLLSDRDNPRGIVGSIFNDVDVRNPDDFATQHGGRLAQYAATKRRTIDRFDVEYGQTSWEFHALGLTIGNLATFVTDLSVTPPKTRWIIATSLGDFAAETEGRYTDMFAEGFTPTLISLESKAGKEVVKAAHALLLDAVQADEVGSQLEIPYMKA